MDYVVTWEMDVSADNPVEAAKLARAIQLRSNARATVFQVFSDDTEEPTQVDLTAIAEGDQIQ